MPRSRPPRSQRRKARRPQIPAGTRPATEETQRAFRQAAVAPRSAVAEETREPSVTRFSSRDYTYVQREIRRIVILAAAIIIAIVVLSFFLP